MASIGSFVNRTTTTTPPGTLQSEGLYYNPKIPRNSQAQGIQGSDDRAYTRTVGSNELVENRLGNLLGGDSAYMQQARQQGLQQAASRGLGNSSIAAGAAQREAIKSGLPIASQDASTYSQAQSENMGALNEGLMQERDIANRMLQANRESGTQLELADRQAAQAEADRRMRLQLQRENLAYEGEQQGLGRAFQGYMGERGYQQDLGRMGAEFGYDLGRMSSDYNFRDNMANNDTFREDWLRSNQFNRDFYGNVALNFQEADIRNSSDFYSRLSQAMLDDPEVFGNPEFLSGINNFFQGEIFDRQFDSFFENYFGG